MYHGLTISIIKRLFHYAEGDSGSVIDDFGSDTAYEEPFCGGKSAPAHYQCLVSAIPSLFQDAVCHVH